MNDCGTSKAAAIAVWSVDALPGLAHRALPEPGLSLCCDGDRRGRGVDSPGSVTIMAPIRTAGDFVPRCGTRIEGLRLKPECASWRAAGRHLDTARPDSRQLVPADTAL
jgi:hypothetical protein